MEINTIIAFLLSAVSAAIFTPITIKLAEKLGVMDVPNDARKIQAKPMPRLGGLAFVMSFLISCLFVFLTFKFENPVNLLGFFIGLAIVAITGFIDDAKGLKPWVKLLGQSLAAVAVIASGVRIAYINIPFLAMYGLNDIISILITFCWIVGVTNAFNLIDGLDGLATGVSAISTLSMLVVFILNGATNPAVYILSAALLGGLIGFLPYNFNPAKTFMGDCGSNFLGFVLATLSMLGMAKTYTFMAIVLPVIILGLPIFDTLFAIGRRALNHKPIMQADRGHLHHRLMDAGLTQKQVVLILYSVTAVLGIFSVVVLESGIWKSIALLLILAVLMVIGSKEVKNRRKPKVELATRVANKDAKIKVMTIFGTRPEAIKMCPLVLELKKNKSIDTIVCVTAQHREMLDQVLKSFEVVPDYDLDIMKSRQTLTHITASVLEGLYDIIDKEKPDMVLVHGDTTTTFVGALASFYAKVKVGHVEAGLRTYDKYSPYPEEINRKLVTGIADLYFAPTENNKNNLLKELVKEEDIYITGNTVIDALKTTVKSDYKFDHEVLSNLDFGKKIIFMTAHRRENLGEPLKNICRAIKTIVEQNEDVEVVYPVHLNPAVREVANEILGDVERVHLIEPLDVITTHNLINKSYMVMTDSGGIQEEAPSLGKPVLVLRTETERPEAVYAGTVRVVGTDYDKIINEANTILHVQEEYDKMSKSANPYGDGKACKRIVDAILYYFNLLQKRPKDMK